MKRKNVYKFGLSIIMAMFLVACSGKNSSSSEKPVESSEAPVSSSSAAPASSSEQSSTPASTSSSTPASSTPASSSEEAPSSRSEQAPASSEQSSESSEQAPNSESSNPEESSENPFNPGGSGWTGFNPGGEGSESNPGGGWTGFNPGSDTSDPNQGGGWNPGQGGSQANPTEPDFTVSAMKFEKADNGKVSLVLDGVVSDSFEGDFTWAWGIASYNTGSSNQATFISGKATPEAEDYAAVTVDAEKKFSVSLGIGDIVEGLTDFTQGRYNVYGGTPDSYGKINPPADASTNVNTDNYHFYFRSASNCICIYANQLHEWVAGTDGKNSEDKVIKNYTCTETGYNAVAAGIAFLDCDAEDVAKVNANGQIDKSGVMHWKIVAPKAGACKLMMASKLSQNWDAYPQQRNNGDVAFDTGYSIKAGEVDGVVTMSGKYYEADFGLNLDSFVYYEVGTLTVEAGENYITFATPANQSFRLLYSEEVRLVFED